MTRRKNVFSKFSVNLLRTGYFMVYENSGGKFGNMIEKHQLKEGYRPDHAKYVHVDVLGPREWAIRVNPPKAKTVDIVKKYKGRRAAMVRYRVGNYDRKRQYVAWWAVSNNNLRYDFAGVVKFKVGWVWHKKNLYFCSENAAWALQQEYPKAFKMAKPHTIMPADFLGARFEKVWEGVIE